MAKLIIDKDTCTGCESCIPSCPFDALSMQEGKAVVDEKCTFCGACVEVCPVNAITLIKGEESATKDTSAKDVWIFVEHEFGKVPSISFELLAKGGGWRMPLDANSVECC
jgi:electron transfer flavoprotein alpha subunit